MIDSPLRSHRVVFGLWLCLLLFPGSPSLVFDGLPLGHQIEVFSALVFLVLLGSKVGKKRIRNWLSRRTTSAVTLCLLVLVLLKLFTFFRFPIGDNFEVCLKSTYRPTSDRCEKSFDYLFHSNDGVNGQGDISRADRTVVYRNSTGAETSILGASHSSWNLPFQNEFPRFSELWMDRLPFTALIGAVINSDVDGYLPVEFVGTLSAEVGAQKLVDEELDHQRLILIPIEKGMHELKIAYSFSDGQSADVPDLAPPPRGPYAHLVLGRPTSANTPIDMHLRIRGYAGTTLVDEEIRQVVVRSDDSDLLTLQESPPEIASTFANPGFRGTGFHLELAVEGGPVDLRPLTVVVQLSDGTERVIGSISPPVPGQLIEGPRVVNLRAPSIISDVEAWYSASDELPPLTAVHRIGPSQLAMLSMRLIDGLLMMSSILALLLAVARRDRLRPWLFATVAALGVWLVAQMPRSIQNTGLTSVFSSPVVTAMLLVVPLVMLRGNKRFSSSCFLTVSSLAIGSSAALRAFRDFTGLGTAPWWGFMVFRDRAMDWFVFQGYAYQMLTQQSLRGGEGIFYFMPGARYFVLLSHILFGNNDVLIGMIVLSSYLGVTLWITNQILVYFQGSRFHLAYSAFFGITIVSIACSQLSVQLATSSSSETFAWLLLLLIPLFALKTCGDFGSFALGAVLGLIVFLRPNYLLVSAGLASGLLLTSHIWSGGKRTLDRVVSRSWCVLGFVATTSLSLVHNVYYAESFTFFTNLADPAQRVFPPGEIFGILTDRNLQWHLFNRFRDFFYWRPEQFGTFQMASWTAQILYVVVVLHTIRVRRFTIAHMLLLATPILYVVSSAPFGIMTIPERQFTAATLALLLSSLLVEIDNRKRSSDVQNS